ncbi:AraC family transcriptional regulator [uncultured Winogradskyella sp.]|uniref:helix-turn-helix domain-containing protein n=1 Tax=uncultured Winogradskyella sp. TaxID=395353 RepID=UPI002626C513|nr:helix-turn-helix domain-containing protein [uncultured Winogradskyella sp.]
MTLLDIIVITSTVVGYFISISLFIAPFYKNRANNYLSLSLFLIVSLIFTAWFETDSVLLEIINNMMLDFLVGVTLFTYFLIQIKHKYLKSNWYKWLYVPFIFSVGIEILISFSDLILGFYNPIFDDVMFYFKHFFSIGLNTFLILFARVLIKKSDTTSSYKKLWLLRLNFYIIVIILCWLLSSLEFHILSSEYITSFLWVITSFLMWWVLYYGVFKLQVVAQKDEIHQSLASKKANSSLKKELNKATSSKIIIALYKLMDEEELYKNPLLSRLDLATRLNTSEVYLSQIINRKLNKSIIQFVNEYRIRAAKDLLHNSEFNKYSVEAIGMEAGFKSKSAFYNAFKTHLDMSPGAFRKLQ